MAVTTKSRLLTTTVAPLNLPTDYKAEAQKAIAENALGGRLLQSAEQRMAYAVLVFAAKLVADGATNYALADVLNNNGAKDFYLPKCKAEFIIPVPTLSKDANDKQREEYNNKSKLVNNANMMFNRAFNLAVLFARDGVTYLQFNHKLGNFQVKPALLMQHDGKPCTPQGRMATDDYIMLDGRSIAFRGHNTKNEEKTWNVNASLAHYKLMNKPVAATRVPRADSGTVTNAETVLKSATPRQIADNVDFEIALEAVFVVFCKDADGATSKRGDYTMKGWNMLGTIAKRVVASQSASDYEAEPFKADNKPVKATRKAA